MGTPKLGGTKMHPHRPCQFFLGLRSQDQLNRPTHAGLSGHSCRASQTSEASLGQEPIVAKGLTWTDENLMAYLLDPKTFLSDFNGETLRNSMSFRIEDEAKRKAAGEGLKTISACQ